MSVALADRPAVSSAAAAQRALPGWPLAAYYVGFPVWWVLGLAGFIAPILALPMLSLLAVRGRIRLPRGFGFWLLFLLWVLASMTMVDTGSRLVGALYRFSLYAAAVVMFLYVYNSRPRDLPLRRVSNYVTCFCAMIVVGGYLGFLFPHGSFATPMEHLLPGSVVSNDLVSHLVHPVFAQTSDPIYGKVPPRPSAPFSYTNNWGANFSMVVPFVLVGIMMARSGVSRYFRIGLLVLAIVPAVATLNRGMTIALAAGTLYAAIRFAQRGHVRALVGVCLVLVAGVTVFSVLHVGSKLNNRVSNSGTNQGRLAVYTQTFDGAMKSPLFGYGAPRPQPTGADVSAQGTFGPSLGTQGQFWTILYSQGFVGTAFYLVGFITLAWRSRRAPTPALVWMHTITLMGLLEIIYYGFQLSEFTLYMVAAAIALRDLPARSHLAAPQRPERIVETLPVVARA